MKKTIQFTLNGESSQLSVDEERPLLWVIRGDLELTGTKFGCGEGLCGACTVLVDNEAVRSCQTPVGAVEGKSVMTIEGLSTNGKLHPIQQAFIDHYALQCGYCTPGMLLNAYGLLMKNPEPSRQDIVEGMEGNLCRCGTYAEIIKAIQSAAKQMKGVS